MLALLQNVSQLRGKPLPTCQSNGHLSDEPAHVVCEPLIFSAAFCKAGSVFEVCGPDGLLAVLNVSLPFARFRKPRPLRCPSRVIML